MAERDDVLLENLREALRQVQRYTVWGIGSALSYFALATTDLGSTSVDVPVPGSFGSFVSVNTEFAKVLALAIFWVAGAMAVYTHEGAIRISRALQCNPDLLRAALTFPSIATEIYGLVRVSAALIPAGLVLTGLVLDAGLRAYIGSTALLMGTAVLLSPYIVFAIELGSRSLPVEVPAKLSLGDKDK